MKNETMELWEKDREKRSILTTYILAGDKKRPAVLICPGGAYQHISEREGEPIALQFNAAGFHAFVLQYRVAPVRHPEPLMDVSRAMCMIRENAEEWNVESDKIAVCGFSAGGHVAASLAVHWQKSYLEEAPGIKIGMNRPNALILCYPVITSGQYAHRGSFENLLGKDCSQEAMHEMSLEHQVNENTPPAFIWHTFEDTAVPMENSLLFAQQMREKNIPFELHIYPKGGHGISLATKETDDGKHGIQPHITTWMKLCVQWLEEQFL